MGCTSLVSLDLDQHNIVLNVVSTIIIIKICFTMMNHRILKNIYIHYTNKFIWLYIL